MFRGVCGRGSGASPPTDCESEVGLGNCCGWERRASGAEPKQLAQHQRRLIQSGSTPSTAAETPGRVGDFAAFRLFLAPGLVGGRGALAGDLFPCPGLAQSDVGWGPGGVGRVESPLGRVTDRRSRKPSSLSGGFSMTATGRPIILFQLRPHLRPSGQEINSTRLDASTQTAIPMERPSLNSTTTTTTTRKLY